MIDIEPIIDALSNYYAGYVLNQNEMDMLRNWREESDEHEELFQQLNNKTGGPGIATGNFRDYIRNLLVAIEE